MMYVHVIQEFYFSEADICGEAKQKHFVALAFASDYVNIYLLCWVLCVDEYTLIKLFFCFGCSGPLSRNSDLHIILLFQLSLA